MKSLQEVYSKYSAWDGGDKGTHHSYIEVYEKEMSKTKNISLLEIGVQFGYSIKMWQEYFDNSWISGIDIDLNKIIFDDLENVFACDATDSNKINKIFNNKKFDYIIDDGSHKVEDQIKSFDILFPRLNSGGKYFIEDIANEKNLEIIKNYLADKNITNYLVYDLREVKDRFDDIVMVINNAKEKRKYS